jgi:transposase
MASTQKTSTPPASPDPEIRPKAVRTQWSARDRLRILEAADACPPGELGALLRREGIYSSHLSRWRRQRAQGELAALEPKRRAEPSPETRAQAAELTRLQRENQRLQAKLAQAEVIIDVQKKLATLLGITLPEPPSDEPA